MPFSFPWCLPSFLAFFFFFSPTAVVQLPQVFLFPSSLVPALLVFVISSTTFPPFLWNCPWQTNLIENNNNFDKKLVKCSAFPLYLQTGPLAGSKDRATKFGLVETQFYIYKLREVHCLLSMERDLWKELNSKYTALYIGDKLGVARGV